MVKDSEKTKLRGNVHIYGGIQDASPPPSKNYYLITSILVLATGASAERLLFKLSADLIHQYRSLLVLGLLTASLIVYYCIAQYKRTIKKEDVSIYDFSRYQLLLMALMDGLSFGCLVISAYGVVPTVTVILMQANIPMTVLGSKYLFPQHEGYTPIQYKGIQIICVSLAVALLRGVFGYSTNYQYHGLSCVLYLCASVLQGYSSLYKERAIIECGKPLDIHLLTSHLLAYQIVITVVLFPLLYLLQVILDDSLHQFHFTDIFHNFGKGFLCLLGWNYSMDLGGDYTCHYVPVYCMMYGISTIAVLQSIQYILITDCDVLNRATSFSIIVTFIVILAYTVYDDVAVSFLDFVAIILLLYGVDLFHVDPEHNVEVLNSSSQNEEHDNASNL